MHVCIWFSAPVGVSYWLSASAPHQTAVSQWGSRLGLSDTKNVLSVGIWGDSATYHTRDAVVVFLINVISSADRTRFWTCSMAKRSLCACGCQGRCTFDAIYKVLAWSFECLVTQRFPSHRHDMVPFSGSSGVGDKNRAAKAGHTLGCRAALVQARGH